MTAIKPTDSTLRDKIDSDGYNSTLNVINSKYAEMDKYIGNLESDITAVKDFEKDVISDRERGYDVGTSLDTLEFQSSSLIESSSSLTLFIFFVIIPSTNKFLYLLSNASIPMMGFPLAYVNPISAAVPESIS